MSEELKNELPNEETPKEEKNGALRWLKIGGILAAIAGCSALALTALNLLTAPVIEANNAAKEAGGYKEVFADCVAVSEEVAIEGNANLSSYLVAYSDSGKTQQIGFIYKSNLIPVQSYGNIQALIGISGSADAPILGKVYLVANTLSYKAQFEDGYVTPYNANPTEETLAATKCGATYGAEALKAIINSARDHFSSIGDDFQENLEQDILDIFGEGSAYHVAYSETSNVSGTTYVKKAYRFFEDETITGEIGRLYSAKYKSEGGDLYLTVGLSGTSEEVQYQKLSITKNTVTESNDVETYVAAYNAAPGETSLASTSDDYTKAIQAMVQEAVVTFKADPLLSCSSYFGTMVSSASSYSEPTVLAEEKGKETLDTGYDYVMRYWSLYSDAEKTNEIAKVYKVRAVLDTVNSRGVPLTSDTTFLVTVSGEKTDPIVGKLKLLKNETNNPYKSSDGKPIIEGYVDQYPEGSSANATYSMNVVKSGIDHAVSLYGAM